MSRRPRRSLEEFSSESTGAVGVASDADAIARLAVGCVTVAGEITEVGTEEVDKADVFEEVRAVSCAGAWLGFESAEIDEA